MAQVSRPFQIALAAVVLFAVVWFVALQGHSSSSSSTPASTPAPATAAKAKAPAGTTHIEGMTRAVTHAREAVAASQRAADKSASASAEGPSKVTSSSTTVVHPAHAAVPAGTVTKSSVTVTRSKHGVPSSKVTVTKTSAHAAPAQQVAVEKQLKQGKVVLVLFWNPKGSDDVAVHKELQAVEKKLGGKVAVHYALAKQVGSYGSITKAIQVYQTPTLLLVNGKGLTTTLTGFTDAFSIEQTINEARQA
jgi:hypothetical protein